MKVKDLIENLNEFPPDLPVMIQVSSDPEYMDAYNVRVGEITMDYDEYNENPFDACIIQYE